MTPVVKRKAIADSKAFCPCPILPDPLTPSRHAGTHTHAPRDMVPPAQLKKREKHPWRSVNPSKHAGFHPTTLLTATLLHGCFFCPLICTNGIQSRNASQYFVWDFRLKKVSNFGPVFQKDIVNWDTEPGTYYLSWYSLLNE